nr:MAG TPA: hypothetical protein [Caudoviricetes sp.]DAY75187.1 MAG TPA: hypothetical protein [Caudoviricetes sp.]
MFLYYTCILVLSTHICNIFLFLPNYLLQI